MLHIVSGQHGLCYQHLVGNTYHVSVHYWHGTTHLIPGGMVKVHRTMGFTEPKLQTCNTMGRATMNIKWATENPWPHNFVNIATSEHRDMANMNIKWATEKLLTSSSTCRNLFLLSNILSSYDPTSSINLSTLLTFMYVAFLSFIWLQATNTNYFSPSFYWT